MHRNNLFTLLKTSCTILDIKYKFTVTPQKSPPHSFDWEGVFCL